MDRGAEGIAAPVDRAVMRPLHHRTNRPKRADADRQPDADRLRRGRDLRRKSPGQRSENRERDRDEIDVDLEDFANEQRSADQIALPFHNPNQEQVKDGDPQLRERGEPQKEFEIGEQCFHLLAYRFAKASRTVGN
jgi:hypothetical protein